MEVEVVKKSRPARTVAVVSVAVGDDVKDALQRVRAWALTRGFPIEGKLSYTIPLKDSERIEVRCPVPPEADVHPDIDIEIQELPPDEIAVVEVPDRAPRTEPEGPDALPFRRPTSAPAVAVKLAAWATESGYRQALPAEVFIAAKDEDTFRVAIAIESREGSGPNFIEV